MAKIHVTDVYGVAHDIDARPGQKLMEVLREYDYGIAASCGGFCSCATCHIYVDSAWRERLPDMQSDERELLTELTTYDPASSRLSCQVPFTDALDGIVLKVAQEE